MEKSKKILLSFLTAGIIVLLSFFAVQAWDSPSQSPPSGNINVVDFSYDTGHVNWGDGLSNEEINRIKLQSGETLIVDRLEFRQKGGGSSSSASVRIQNKTDGTTLGSQDLGGVTTNLGETSAGDTIQVQITNSTGNSIEASVRVMGHINQ